MKKLVSILLVIMLAFTLVSCSNTSKQNNQSRDSIETNQSTTADKKTTDSFSNIQEPTKSTEQAQQSQDITQTTQDKTQSTQSTASIPGELKVHYIDVGQADSILIQDDAGAMLIDAGNNADSETVVNYIKKQGISKLDYVIGTHPHEDHIGGLDAVINVFNIGTIYMPKVSSTTQTFQDVLTAIKNKGLAVTTPVPGSTFKLGDAVCTILGPNNGNYEDLNNYSIVLKVVFGSNKFLFQGDAGEVSENEAMSKGFDISADVIKIGHHGSDTSSSQAYLNKVKPKYAVISVGKGNDYGHPADSTLSKLNNMGVKIFRTDESGTIIATSDKTNVIFNSKPSTNIPSNGGSKETSSTQPAVTTTSPAVETTAPATVDNDRTVYYTPSGKSYHYSKDCSTLSRSKTILEGKLQDVINMGKSDPCDKCVH